VRVLTLVEQYKAIRIYKASPVMIQAYFKDIFLRIKSLLSVLQYYIQYATKKKVCLL